MDILELNLPAKVKYFEALKRKRVNQMRQWRKCKLLSFNNHKDLNEWLDYTKWHKRPMQVKDSGWNLLVTFLDYKGKTV
jgi:hypothetical protein